MYISVPFKRDINGRHSMIKLTLAPDSKSCYQNNYAYKKTFTINCTSKIKKKHLEESKIKESNKGEINVFAKIFI